MVDVSKHHAGQLDSLRAIAVTAVIFSHTIPDTYAIGQYRFIEFGAYGVYLFFILSSYLITSQLIAASRERIARGDGIAAPVKSFYAKRALRLLPAYYLALFGAVALNLGEIRSEFPWHAAMLSEFLFAIDPHAEMYSPAGHFWTLSVEWQFYLVWPWVVLLVRERWLPIVMGLGMLVSLYSWSPWSALPWVIDKLNLLQSFDSLIFGAALAWAQARGWRLDWLSWAGWLGWLAFLAGIPPLAIGGEEALKYFWIPVHEGMNFAFVALIYFSARGYSGAIGRLLNLQPLQYLGRISYGVYLYHMFIIVTLEKVFQRKGWGELPYDYRLTLFILVTSIATAALSWHFFELPINRLRARFGYRSQEPPSDLTPDVDPADPGVMAAKNEPAAR